MAQDHEIQSQRFELKYLIEKPLAPLIRDFVSSYLELDEYAVGRPNFSYPVHSLYLDSLELKTFHMSVNGAKNRFKLRLRYYDEASPVFIEIKGRVDNCILKRRCPVRRQAIPCLLAGQLPGPDDLFSSDPRQWAVLHEFNSLLLNLNARPKAHNHYFREAWVSPVDSSVRVTIDRQVRLEPYFLPDPVLEMRQPVQVFPGLAVLELKFTARFPGWFQELVRRFNLMQFSSAKYAEGIIMTGEHWFYGEPRDRWLATTGSPIQSGNQAAAVSAKSTVTT